MVLSCFSQTTGHLSFDSSMNFLVGASGPSVTQIAENPRLPNLSTNWST